jgi:hypothetical protein
MRLKIKSNGNGNGNGKSKSNGFPAEAGPTDVRGLLVGLALAGKGPVHSPSISRRLPIVPTLRVVMPPRTLCVLQKMCIKPPIPRGAWERSTMYAQRCC